MEIGKFNKKKKQRSSSLSKFRIPLFKKINVALFEFPKST